MAEEGKSSIKIGDVKGDITVSQDQSGGTTAHTSNSSLGNAPERKSRFKRIVIIVGLAASIVTVLAYCGIKPKLGVNMENDDDKSIVVGDVQGNVVISQNQTGGITAHSVSINETHSPEWSLTQSEIVDDEQWRAKLSVKGVGKLAYYNWNVLSLLSRYKSNNNNWL